MKFQSIVLSGLLFSGAVAQAASVNVSSSSNLAGLVLGETFRVDVSGEGFPAPIVGGAFALAFDPSVLTLRSANPWVVDTSVWNLGGGQSSVTGDYFFNAFSLTNPPTYPQGNMNIGDLFFEVVGLGSTTIRLSDPTLNWATTGGQAYPNQDQIQYGSLAVATVPIPAAVWLFGTALTALGGLTRRHSPS